MIQMIGIDHTSAPVEVRSVFTFRKNEMIETMERIRDELHADGIVLLSTCNRMELWLSGNIQQGQILSALCACKQVEEQEYASCFTLRQEEDALRHLFYLTCGLKSAIVAEDQILTQVKEAVAFARANYFSDSVLEVLFRMAVSAAKKVKTEVTFTHADTTAIEHAIGMLRGKGFSLAGRKCMVIGNGEYGRLAASTLAAQGADVTVTVRQYHSGIVLIPEGCRQIHYGEKMDYFPSCELVVSATTSPNYTLFYDKVSACQIDHPMILLDFAVPRDIDPKIRELEGYTVYDIDDFQSDPGTVNQQAYAQADRILQEKMVEFHLWMNYRDLVPHIDHIRAAAVQDVSLRLHKTVRALPVEAEKQQKLEERIEDASGKVVSRMLYMLRDSLDEDTFRRCVGVIENGYLKEQNEEAGGGHG